MGKKSTPRTPRAPDPNELIRTQAEVNRVNTESPYGSVSWSGNQDTGFTQTTELSPEMQGLLDQQIGMASGGDQGKSYSSRDMPNPVAQIPDYQGQSQTPAGPYQNDMSMGSYGDSQYQELERALYDREMNLIQPQFDQQTERFKQSMSDRGLPVGGDAYSDEYRLMADRQDRLSRDIALDSVLAGRNAFEEDRNFAFNDRNFDYGVYGDQRDYDNQNYRFDRTLDRADFESDRNFANTLNQQDFYNSEAMTEADRAFYLNNNSLGLQSEGQRYNQLASLLGNQPTSPIIPLDVTSPYAMKYDGEMARYMSQLNGSNNAWGNLGQLGGTLLSAWIGS